MMELLDIMKARHSVRQYQDRKIEESIRKELKACLDDCNKESGLHIQIIYDEDKCFDTMMARYGKFTGVTNYIALVGKNSETLEEIAGYYGEKLVLKAQELGLNTCWVAMTYGKGKCAPKIDKGEKLVCVIALGYGQTQGMPHKNKDLAQVCNLGEGQPSWFLKGMEAALLAPTAMNQQKFYFCFQNNQVSVKAGLGFYTKLDLGIVKYHFEAVSGHKIK